MFTSGLLKGGFYLTKSEENQWHLTDVIVICDVWYMEVLFSSHCLSNASLFGP